MVKKKKFWLSFISIVLFLAIAACVFAGNYLVDYALVVDEEGRLGSMGSEMYTGVQDTQAQKDYDAWKPSVKSEEWTITSEDGLSLWGEFYPSTVDSHVYVLGVHGYTVDHRDIAPAIKPFADKGYNVLTPDQRGRGNSEGDFLSMGWLEKDDALLWINKIIDYDKQAQIILYGESMGAATLMMASGEVLPKQVLALVEDCGYTSAYEMFANQLQERFGLPEMPFLPAAAIVGQLRTGFNFNDASALEQLEKATLPILFIHGDADDYVPTRMGKDLYEAYQGEKELLIIEGAGHGSSADINPERYYTAVFNFIESYL